MAFTLMLKSHCSRLSYRHSVDLILIAHAQTNLDVRVTTFRSSLGTLFPPIKCIAQVTQLTLRYCLLLYCLCLLGNSRSKTFFYLIIYACNTQHIMIFPTINLTSLGYERHTERLFTNPEYPVVSNSATWPSAGCWLETQLLNCPKFKVILMKAIVLKKTWHVVAQPICRSVITATAAIMNVFHNNVSLVENQPLYLCVSSDRITLLNIWIVPKCLFQLYIVFKDNVIYT